MRIVGSAGDQLLVFDSNNKLSTRDLRDAGMNDRVLTVAGCDAKISQYGFTGRQTVTAYQLELGSHAPSPNPEPKDAPTLYGGSRVLIRRLIPKRQLRSSVKRHYEANPSTIYLTPSQWINIEDLRVNDWICISRAAPYWHQNYIPDRDFGNLQLIPDRVNPNDLASRLRMRAWGLSTLVAYGADRYGVYRQVVNKTVSSVHCPVISLAVDSGGAVVVNNLYVAAPLIPQASRTNA